MSAKNDKNNKKNKRARNSDQSSGSYKKPIAYVGATIVVAVAVVAILQVLERRVLTGQVRPAPAKLQISLVDRPQWMPRTLANQIAAKLLPPSGRYYDRALTDEVAARACANPWVSKIVRAEKFLTPDRATAIIEVKASFRMPIAKVRTGSNFTYVDCDGVSLPSEQVPKWAADRSGSPGATTYYLDRRNVPPGRAIHRIHYVVIEGAESLPPQVGKQWAGEDIKAALRLIKLIMTKPYAYQITAVDVRNHKGRISNHEPHLRMYAQFGQSSPTDIHFGRFPIDDEDYVVSPARKLSYLDEYFEDHNGRLAGLNRYLDLRYDELHVSIN